MGTLLDFSATARPRWTDRPQLPEEGATILVFPGVRVDRQTVDLAAQIRKVTKETGSSAQPEV